VFATGRDEARLNNLEGIRGHLACDLTAPRKADVVVESAVGALRGLDAVIHCAGIGLIKSAKDTSDTDFVRVTNTNLRGTFLIAKATAEAMSASGGGRFLTIPGILGKAPMRGASAYCASKYGVVGLIKSMALEYQRAGVQFCLFHFGGVDSPFWDDIDMKVQRDKMIPTSVAASALIQAVEAPQHLVTSEVTIQPETHQL
jgi:NAD(P)-dependent dehydrogenase (short-subunit alcohol dehydrogenase family)